MNDELYRRFIAVRDAIADDLDEVIHVMDREENIDDAIDALREAMRAFDAYETELVDINNLRGAML